MRTLRAQDLSIGTKLLAVAAAACVCMIALGALTGMQMRNERFADRRTTVRSAVQTAGSVISLYAAEEASGKLTRAEAQARALTAIKSMRYGNKDYFWINDYDGLMVMHAAKPELDGTDVLGLTDPDGVQIFQEFIDVAKDRDAGFVAYQWPKPGSDEPQPKISYVQGYPEWNWIIGTGVYVDDINAAVATDLRRIALEIGLAGILLTWLILLVRRQVTRPLARMTALLQGSDLRQRLDEGRGRTELCRLSAAVNKNLDTVSTMVDGVVTTAGKVSENVHALGSSAQEIDAQAARTSEQAEEVATASRTVVSSYNEVETAVSEIDTSIRTIAENVQHVASVVSDAVEATERTNQVVTRLDASSAEIGAVVATITSIAEQTNMLALNATIESARAGEAGKGFAVVATEVKELAQETARATEDIARRVQTLQDDARESVGALGRIAEVIGQINEYQGGIAAAVEEQSVTMSHVNRSVSESSRAGAGTGESIGEVAQATSETRRALDRVTEIIGSLRTDSGHLEKTVEVFRR